MRSLVVPRRWWSISALAALAVAASVFAASTGAAPSPASQVSVQLNKLRTDTLTCKLSQSQPAAPLEMNTVAANGLFKTVAMEKEIFECTDSKGVIGQIRDVETFLEIVGTEKRTIEVRAELATCVKDFASGQIECGNSPLELGTTDAPIKGCDPLGVSAPADPVVMNTEALGKSVKTIKVEKEVFTCAGAPATIAAPVEVRDVYIFTEIIESLRNLSSTSSQVAYRPTIRRFLGIVCTKLVPAGTVASCMKFTPLQP